MLLINKKSLTIAELKKEFKKSGDIDYGKEFIFRMPNNAYYWSPENNKMIVRNSQAIPTAYSLPKLDEKGSFGGMVELRFARTMQPNQTNNLLMDYQPTYIEIPVKGYIKTTFYDEEQNYFLHNAPWNGTGPNKPTGIRNEIMFETHDKLMVARMQMAAARKENSAVTLVSGPTQLSSEELSKVAYGFFNADSALYGFYDEPKDMWNKDEDTLLRYHMLKLAKSNPEKFMKFFENTMTDVRGLVKKATDKRILVYDKETKRFSMKNENGQNEMILQVKTGEEPAVALLTFLEDTDVAGTAQTISRRLSALVSA